MRFVVPDLADPNAHPRAVRRAVGHKAALVLQAQRDHDERIRPLLPPALQQLQEMPIDDSFLRFLRIDAKARTVQIGLMRCGDLQRGYCDLYLFYKDIELTQAETTLLCFLAHYEAEVKNDEVDLDEETEPATFIHRISWHTKIQTDYEVTHYADDGEPLGYVYCLGPEIEFQFGSIELELTPEGEPTTLWEEIKLPKQLFSNTNAVIIVARDPDKIEGMD